MSRRAEFAYAQARLQARHGMRPSESTWRLLDASKDLAHFLQVARNSPLRPWVEHLPRHADAHLIERSLRGDWRAYVRTVAVWCPGVWRPAVAWAALLVDLPAIAHCLSHARLPAWMRGDPALLPFAATERSARIEALQQSEWAPVVRRWLADASVLGAWMEHWETLWAGDGRTRTALGRLASAVREHMRQTAQADPTRAAGDGARRELEARATRLFRRHTQQPPAVFAHLALIALDLERMRDGLMRRSLFGEGEGGATWA
ncbi:MAG: hypothetical protein GWN84_23980 [Gammaproteobacteria bacterium]|nr:hypothetical protein [Gammaproteobacteria bacterium]NIR85642.1 hypothetical protein [Gammaproteobacteria bacterium]NIR90130.1 hypothetical protein [Gammaproteobacteria bacterium]NIU06776.1 hypothetical protein [Gammaproteobacteria bacterium]NIV53709.1 hypothetical protein [Gammaproteobacteria bacterium]